MPVNIPICVQKKNSHNSTHLLGAYYLLAIILEAWDTSVSNIN